MTAREVACPRCGRKTPFTPDNGWRPFCSERCKTIDLGAWADERYRVPVKPGPDDDFSDLKDTSQ